MPMEEISWRYRFHPDSCFIYIWKVFLQHSNTFLTFIINSNSNSIFINSFIIYMRRMKQKLLYKAKLLFKKSEYC